MCSAAVREIDRSLQPFTVAALHELVVTLILPSEEGKYLNLCLIRLLISKKIPPEKTNRAKQHILSAVERRKTA